MNRIFEVIVFVAILILIMSSGCATLRGFLQSPAGDEPTIAPKPTEQLWQAAKKSNWIVTFSILGIAGGIFALVNGATKLGTAAIASASVSLFMSLAVARFALWMAVFGLIGSVAAALFSILVRRKALVEIIRGVQKYKENNIAAPTKKTLKEILNKQSQTTKKIVGNMKNELRLKGAI